jgi:hypothetical protein
VSTLSSPGALRHDLRSEINQLLGYNELLLEETDLESGGRLNARLDRIRQVARQTLVAELVLSAGDANGERPPGPRPALTRIP